MNHTPLAGVHRPPSACRPKPRFSPSLCPFARRQAVLDGQAAGRPAAAVQEGAGGGGRAVPDAGGGRGQGAGSQRGGRPLLPRNGAAQQAGAAWGWWGCRVAAGGKRDCGCPAGWGAGAAWWPQPLCSSVGAAVLPGGACATGLPCLPIHVLGLHARPSLSSECVHTALPRWPCRIHAPCCHTPKAERAMLLLSPATGREPGGCEPGAAVAVWHVRH